MKNIFEKEVSQEIINRINNLTSKSTAVWGKMSVAQMLAHCCITYEMIYEKTHVKPNKFKALMLNLFVKNIVVGEKSYKTNSRTAPEFIVSDEREFEKEKERLIKYINKTQELGSDYFDNKESHSFGKLSATEWNNMFYKHLDHHLHQFSV